MRAHSPPHNGQDFDPAEQNDSPAGHSTVVRPKALKLNMMRWVDHWVGLPVCFGLGLLAVVARKVLPLRNRTITGKHPLAVFKFFGLGSILQATPLLRAIRERYPETRLVFVTFEGNESLLRRLDICTDLRIIRTSSIVWFAHDVMREIIWLWWHRVEGVVDLEFFSKFSTLLSFLSRAPVRIGFHLNDFWRSSLLTTPVYFNYFRHISDVYQQAARRLGVEITDRQLSRLAVDDDAIQSAKKVLHHHGWRDDDPLLGMNVNAGDMSLERRWPMEHFVSLIEALLQRHQDLRVVLTGSPDEESYVRCVYDHISKPCQDRVIVVAGQWSLGAFIAGLSLFDGFVTNDSGPMHLAAAQEVPMVSLWGPGRPEFYAPNVVHHEYIYEDYPCSPCLYMFTSFEGMWCHHEGWCMQAVPPEKVLDATERMLAETARRRRSGENAHPETLTGGEKNT